jgi:ribosome-associated toxin RatA of RatAB toxin-antitoxin module
VAELTIEEVFTGNVELAFSAIRQYQKYPEYLPGVTKIEVLPAKAPGSVCQVRYDLKFIKTFYYTLDMFEDKPKKIWWNLADSNLLQVSNGSWCLSPASRPDETKAVYTIEVGFSGFVPGKVVDQITKANLPMMMKGFQRLITDVGKEL